MNVECVLTQFYMHNEFVKIDMVGTSYIIHLDMYYVHSGESIRFIPGTKQSI